MRTHHLPTPHRALTTEESRLALILLRRSIQDQIESDLDRIDDCLRFLDRLDGDPDFEPSLCGRMVGGPSPGGEDREDDTEDNEPSLGLPECTAIHTTRFLRLVGYFDGGGLDHSTSQERWSSGGRDDREDVNEDGGDINDEGHATPPEWDGVSEQGEFARRRA